MGTLSEKWLTEDLMDFEYKKYLVLGYLQIVETHFNEQKLYPDFAELIAHYKNIIQLKNNTATLENNVGWGGSKMYADLGIGLLYYSEKHWLGISGYHLNMPNVGFGSTASRLPISISAHAGIRMYVGRERGIQREVRNTFSPAVLLRNSANLFQFDFTGIYDFHPLLVGFGYRGIPILKYNKMQNDAIIFMAGYRTAQLIIAYSYDLTISSLGISTLGAHEIGIVFEFGDRAGGSKKANRVLYTPFPLLYSN